MAIAVVLLVCVGMRRELAAALSVGDCVALASVPITWTAVRKARRFSLLLVLSILASGTAYIMSCWPRAASSSRPGPAGSPP